MRNLGITEDLPGLSLRTPTIRGMPTSNNLIAKIGYYLINIMPVTKLLVGVQMLEKPHVGHSKEN